MVVLFSASQTLGPLSAFEKSSFLYKAQGPAIIFLNLFTGAQQVFNGPP